MNAGVPMIAPEWVIWTSSRSALAWPKSRILARPFGASSQMFAGLMSRWTSPSLWAAPEPGGDLPADPQDEVDRRLLAPIEPAPERQPLEVFHRQEGHAPGLAHLVDRDDVIVLDGRGGPGLAHEAGGRLGRGGQLGSDHLEGHRAEEVGILGQEDQSHAPGADQPANAVVRQPAEFVAVPRGFEEGILREASSGVTVACGSGMVSSRRYSIVRSVPGGTLAVGRREARASVCPGPEDRSRSRWPAVLPSRFSSISSTGPSPPLRNDHGRSASAVLLAPSTGPLDGRSRGPRSTGKLHPTCGPGRRPQFRGWRHPMRARAAIENGTRLSFASVQPK